MTVRTTETNVTFKRPFSRSEFERPQSAGTYRVVADDEEISDLSFLAFRRIATTLRLPSPAASRRREEMVPIDAHALSAALAADGERQ